MRTPFIFVVFIFCIVLETFSAQLPAEKSGQATIIIIPGNDSENDFKSKCAPQAPANCRHDELQKMVLDLLKKAENPPKDTPVKDWFSKLWKSIRDAVEKILPKKKKEEKKP